MPINWIADFDPPNGSLTDEMVAHAEEQLGVKLPAAYVELMRDHNGGYVEEQAVAASGAAPPALAHYLDEGHAFVGSIFGIGSSESHGSILCSPIMIKEWGLPDGLVLLDGDGHVWIAIDYRAGRAEPAVILIESDTGQSVELAASFAEFLGKTVPSKDFGEDSDHLHPGDRDV